jgi:3',5'-cyclic AMP phosphodiesterase CpdA
MRFIHASDLHIDSPLRGLDRYDGAPVERLRSATRSACERLVDRALAERVDFLLLAGDIYDRGLAGFSHRPLLSRAAGAIGARGHPLLYRAGKPRCAGGDLASVDPAVERDGLFEPRGPDDPAGGSLRGDPWPQLS